MPEALIRSTGRQAPAAAAQTEYAYGPYGEHAEPDKGSCRGHVVDLVAGRLALAPQLVECRDLV